MALPTTPTTPPGAEGANDARAGVPVVGHTDGRAAGRVGAEAVLRRRRARESPARAHVRSFPVVPVRAHGMTVGGADGRRHLGRPAGADTPALGRDHPVVPRAARRTVAGGAPLHAPDPATPRRDECVEVTDRRCRPGARSDAGRFA